MSPRGQGRAFELGRRLRSPMNVYWYYERVTARWLGAAGVLLALPAIPVLLAHGGTAPEAGAIGAVLALAALVVGFLWRRPWSPWAAALVVVLMFGPALAWSAWAFFAGLYAFVVLLVVVQWRRSRRRFLRLENKVRAQDGKPPYVTSQEAIAEAYRAARG